MRRDASCPRHTPHLDASVSLCFHASLVIKLGNVLSWTCSPGFPEGILGGELTEKFRAQSARFGTQIFTETVTSVDLSQRPFSIVTDDREVICHVELLGSGASSQNGQPRPAVAPFLHFALCCRARQFMRPWLAMLQWFVLESGRFVDVIAAGPQDPGSSRASEYRQLTKACHELI